ncbi:hypothetical protein D3C71_1844670 [compost metagenome]
MPTNPKATAPASNAAFLNQRVSRGMADAAVKFAKVVGRKASPASLALNPNTSWRY